MFHKKRGIFMGNRVEPIRDKRKIATIKNMLKGSNKTRDYILFSLGINLGLRIGDLLKIQVKDLFDVDDNIRETFEIVEEKTKKRNVVLINENTKEALKYLIENEPTVLNNRNNHIIYNTRNKYESITRIQAYKLTRSWCDKVGLEEIAIGCHTLRKTWGYQAHKEGISIEVIQEKYKHSSTSTTRHYLGIEQKDVNEAYKKVNL